MKHPNVSLTLSMNGEMRDIGAPCESARAATGAVRRAVAKDPAQTVERPRKVRGLSLRTERHVEQHRMKREQETR